MPYTIFRRATIKKNGDPHPWAQKRIVKVVSTREEARAYCTERNEEFDFRGKGPLKEFWEFEKQ